MEITQAKVKEARRKGYTDDQILDYIGSKDKDMASKIQRAVKAGHPPSKILGHLAPEPSKARSLISAPLKGIVKGIGEIGEFFTPLAFQDEPFEEREEMKRLGHEARERFEKGPLEKALPTQEGFLERSLERGGEMLPLTAAGGGGIVASGVRSLLAGVAGEGIKSAGGGPLAQTVGEIVAMGLPGFGKKILATKSQKPLVDFARKMGLTEEEIAPLIQGKGKQAFWGKLAKKKGRAEEVLKKTQEARSRIYEKMKNSPMGQASMSKADTISFLQEITNEMKNLPHEVRQKIVPDLLDFARAADQGKGNAAELMNLWADINHYVMKESPRLGILKGSIENAFKKSFPGFSEEFELTRELYKRFYPLAKKLKPGMSEKLIDAGEAGTLLYGLANFNLGLLGTTLGVEGARRFAREMLINPRMQNLHKQMLKAINENKFTIAQKLADQMVAESSQQKEKSLKSRQ